MIVTCVREVYLIESTTIPDKKKAVIKRILITGVLFFLLGFLIWNLDNIFCVFWTRVKRAVGWPMAFFLEGEFYSSETVCFVSQRLCLGHAWWHIFTVRPFQWIFTSLMR